MVAPRSLPEEQRDSRYRVFLAILICLVFIVMLLSGGSGPTEDRSVAPLAGVDDGSIPLEGSVPVDSPNSGDGSADLVGSETSTAGEAVDEPPAESPLELGEKTDEWLDELGDPTGVVDFAANDGDADPAVEFAVLTDGYDAVIGSGEVALVAEGQSAVDAVVMDVVDGSSQSDGQLLAESPILADVEEVLPATTFGPSALAFADEDFSGGNGAAGAGFVGFDEEADDAIEFTEVLPGIDMVYSVDDGNLEYSSIIEPGADPDALRARLQKEQARFLDRFCRLFATYALGRELRPAGPSRCR